MRLPVDERGGPLDGPAGCIPHATPVPADGTFDLCITCTALLD